MLSTGVRHHHISTHQNRPSTQDWTPLQPTVVRQKSTRSPSLDKHASFTATTLLRNDSILATDKLENKLYNYRSTLNSLPLTSLTTSSYLTKKKPASLKSTRSLNSRFSTSFENMTNTDPSIEPSIIKSLKSKKKNLIKKSIVPKNKASLLIPLSPARYMILPTKLESNLLKNNCKLKSSTKYSNKSMQQLSTTKKLKTKSQSVHSSRTRTNDDTDSKITLQVTTSNRPKVKRNKVSDLTNISLTIANIPDNNNNSIFDAGQNFSSVVSKKRGSVKNSAVLSSELQSSLNENVNLDDLFSTSSPKTFNKKNTDSKVLTKSESSKVVKSTNDIEDPIVKNKKFSSQILPLPPAPLKGILKPSKSRNYPMFADIGLCTAHPCSKEWSQYWERYDAALDDYKKSEEAYLAENPEYKQDIEKYSQQAAKFSLEDALFRESIGLEVKKDGPELFRVPFLGLRSLHGFVFNLTSGPNGLNAFLSSSGNKGFRLEIDVRDYNRDSILVETEFNLMKIQVPTDKTKSRYKSIVIGVPNEYKLEDLQVYPIVNGWLIVETCGKTEKEVEII